MPSFVPNSLTRLIVFQKHDYNIKIHSWYSCVTELFTSGTGFERSGLDFRARPMMLRWHPAVSQETIATWSEERRIVYRCELYCNNKCRKIPGQNRLAVRTGDPKQCPTKLDVCLSSVTFVPFTQFEPTCYLSPLDI
jgi:hypothetical protein